MTNRRLPLLFLFALPFIGLSAQGIEFYHGSWAEALAKAEAEDKLIFVDAYASWCGPCKRMAAQVFPQPEVGEYFNENFIAVKYDMEKEESKEFRRKHSVRAYPTLFFINAENEVVYKTVGGKQAGQLIQAGETAMMKMDDLPSLAERWEAGERDAKTAFKYIRALVRQQKPHLKVANDYIRDQRDLTTDDNLSILLVATTEADSRLFDLLLENEDAAVAHAGREAFDATVAGAAATTIDKAVEFNNEDLLKTTVKKMAGIDKAASKRMAARGKFQLALKNDSPKAAVKEAKKYLKVADDDPTQLRNLYDQVVKSRHAANDDLLRLAADAGARAALSDADGGFKQLFRIADFLLKQGKKDLALDFAKRSQAIAPEGNAAYRRAIDGLIQRIQSAP